MMRAVLTSLAVFLGVSHAAFAQSPPTPPSAGAPADFPPLFCTVTAADLCTAGAGCKAAESFGDLKLPAKLLIHVDRKIVATTNAEGFPHVSVIASFAEAGDALILQGIDGVSGWMIHVEKSDPKMTFSVASNDAVLTGSGTCKAAE